LRYGKLCLFVVLGVAIKKFKLSNLSAIFILLAADLGIGYFTLPYVFHMDNICGKLIRTNAT
jgi:hypothetical protein